MREPPESMTGGSLASWTLFCKTTMNVSAIIVHTSSTERMGKEVVIEGVPGVIDHFLVEPFFPHKQEEEMCVP